MNNLQSDDPVIRADDVGTHEASGAPTPSAPGAWLAAAREARGLTIDQVASQLNFAPRQVLALEADDYAALPGMVIVRGFLRSYAKLLKVDPSPLLALLVDKPASSTAPMRHALSASFSETRLPTLTGSGKRSKTMPVVAGFAVLVVAAAASYALGWWPEALSRRAGLLKLGALAPDGAAPTSAAPVSGSTITTDGPATALMAGMPTAAETASAGAMVSGVAATVAPAPGLPGASATTDMSATAAAMATTTAAAATPVPVTKQEAATAVAVSASPAAPGKSPAAQPAVKPATAPPAAAIGNPLVLNIQRDSWVEIKRSDNTPVIARVIKAGSVETFDIAEPVTLTVGNIAGVEATLRGAPLELASVATGNVARLRLK